MGGPDIMRFGIAGGFRQYPLMAEPAQQAAKIGKPVLSGSSQDRIADDAAVEIENLNRHIDSRFGRYAPEGGGVGQGVIKIPDEQGFWRCYMHRSNFPYWGDEGPVISCQDAAVKKAEKDQAKADSVPDE